METKGESPFSSFLSVDVHRIELDSMFLKNEDSALLDKLIVDNENQTDDDLLEKIYKAYPFMESEACLLIDSLPIRFL